ncbi:hypothetical protein ACVWWJ_002807 [Luteibacter sp. HA06]
MLVRLPCVLALLVMSSTAAVGQTAPSPTAAPKPNPAVPATPGGNPAAAPSPVQVNPGSAPVQAASDAGATERGLAPVQPGHHGVTQRVQNANTHDLDAQGHTLDPHGRPVGQAAAPSVAPAAASTVH